MSFFPSSLYQGVSRPPFDWIMNSNAKQSPPLVSANLALSLMWKEWRSLNTSVISRHDGSDAVWAACRLRDNVGIGGCRADDWRRNQTDCSLKETADRLKLQISNALKYSLVSLAEECEGEMHTRNNEPKLFYSWTESLTCSVAE